ncbi:alpha/beta hydrolase [Roseisolibacter sp. H3M3-2]|uniref:alpha/beta hydrolase n=1 Tax=Roseisolibacter sp. H3M3-2 TaxID=3031323 RepID=UPI0023DC31E2|nr:alpha/beta hydrolase [Roseisolibacter sp. H3M3-2]MDF1503232.1 alpha/beta hydrolase [Roseisolibacter sp. H3M3-2]
MGDATTRRTAARHARALGVGVALLAGCGGGGERRADSAGGAVTDDGAAVGAPASAAASAAAAAEPEMQAVLDQHAKLGPKPIETLTPEEARRQPTPADAVTALLVAQGKDTTPAALVPGVTAADRTVRGAAGDLPATVYTPEGAGPFPVVVYFHGGGWVIADRKVYDGGARGLAKAANAVVVSVDYRRAPEAKFPAQHDDALAAYRWALANAASIKGDPKRVALAGESAGGNLAVATAVAARDAGLQAPAAVVSVYPIAQPDTTTASYATYAAAKPLNRPMMGWFAKHTTRTPADLQDPRIALVKANLANLPPVTIVNAEIDPLRDDGAMLERALKAADVPVERRLYDGVAHEFFGMAAVEARAKDAQAYAGSRLKAAFGG